MNFLEAMLHEGVPEHMARSVLKLMAPVGVGNKHTEVLETYQRHLRSGSPTQATRPKWSDIHAALDAAQTALLANPQPGAAVGEEISDAMLKAGVSAIRDCAKLNMTPEKAFPLIWRAALRTLTNTDKGADNA